MTEHEDAVYDDSIVGPGVSSAGTPTVAEAAGSAGGPAPMSIYSGGIGSMGSHPPVGPQGGGGGAGLPPVGPQGGGGFPEAHQDYSGGIGHVNSVGIGGVEIPQATGDTPVADNDIGLGDAEEPLIDQLFQDGAMSDVSMPSIRSRASSFSGPRGTQLEYQEPYSGGIGPEVTPPPEEIMEGTTRIPPRPQEELHEPLGLTHIATPIITDPPDEITNGPQPLFHGNRTSQLPIMDKE